MRRAIFLLLIPISVVAAVSSARACDPNEECHRCLASVLGNCVTYGNDPVCEVRKADCQAHQAAENSLNACFADLQSCAQDTLNQIADNDVRLLNACINDLPKCPENVIKRLPAHALLNIIEAYKATLFAQASNKWQKLPGWFISEFGPAYPNIDLARVRFATGINTKHGNAITFAYNIFFPSAVDLDERDGKEWMLHELTHTRQYEDKGGEEAFLSEYILHAAGNVLSKGSINIHDDISIEQDAITNARTLVNKYGYEYHATNSCNEPFMLLLKYMNVQGSWETTGTWTLKPGQSNFLGFAGIPAHTKNRPFYWYAETTTSHRPLGNRTEPTKYKGKIFNWVHDQFQGGPYVEIEPPCT
jgi:hypothetical protein